MEGRLRPPLFQYRRITKGGNSMIIEERQSTHVYRQKQLFTKEELEARESLCVHEQPPYCNAACPLKLDTKAMMAAIAARDFNKAMQLYEKITPFPVSSAPAVKPPVRGNASFGNWATAFLSGRWRPLPYATASGPKNGDFCGRRRRKPPFSVRTCLRCSWRVSCPGKCIP